MLSLDHTLCVSSVIRIFLEYFLARHLSFYLCSCIHGALIVQDAEFNVEAAQRGIVYIDEVDKLTKKV